MRAALLQSCTGLDPEANAAALVAVIAQARAAGADMLFTPEMSGLVDRDRTRAAGKIVTEANDRVLAAVRDAAARNGLWVHLGSLALREQDGAQRFVNRSLVIDDVGAIRARYDKIHLFDVDLPDGGRWRESDVYAPGRRAVAVETPWGRIGLSVCYDLRFPDLYRALTDAGATILSVPAAFTVPTGQAHWHVLLRARAIEAGVFVVAAAQTGTHADGRLTYGHSLAVDPWGETLLDIGEAEGLALVELDPARIEATRGRVPALAHRRPIDPVEIAA